MGYSALKYFIAKHNRKFGLYDIHELLLENNRIVLSSSEYKCSDRVDSGHKLLDGEIVIFLAEKDSMGNIKVRDDVQIAAIRNIRYNNMVFYYLTLYNDIGHEKYLSWIHLIGVGDAGVTVGIIPDKLRERKVSLHVDNNKGLLKFDTHADKYWRVRINGSMDLRGVVKEYSKYIRATLSKEVTVTVLGTVAKIIGAWILEE